MAAVLDLGRPGLILLLAGITSTIVYLRLAKNKHSPTRTSRVAPVSPTGESLPEKDKNRVRQSLEVLYPGSTDHLNEEVKVNIIAMHGLGSNVDWSWTWKGDGKHINWLRDPDMLPAKVAKSRILAYNYDSKWHADAPKTAPALRRGTYREHTFTPWWRY
ncbi:hypothetical protein B0T25DRAFT_225700 [Lasiosphaeria hispida]|uniref:Uncharacterized protein n=1 Tax=Lasiosphaeria hispida TaxID=260671 RepID=A0AAJ0MBG7_9PEZI|nr:hypothetical protein B0T25DRAFT_225700 [Lasiosphaeria hispida]